MLRNLCRFTDNNEVKPCGCKNLAVHYQRQKFRVHAGIKPSLIAGLSRFCEYSSLLITGHYCHPLGGEIATMGRTYDFSSLVASISLVLHIFTRHCIDPTIGGNWPLVHMFYLHGYWLCFWQEWGWVLIYIWQSTVDIVCKREENPWKYGPCNPNLIDV